MMLVFLLTSTQVGFSGSQDYMDIIDQIMLNVSNSTDCWIPGFDLVRRDLEYRKVFQHVSPLRCKPLQPDLTFYENGIFSWNQTLLSKVSVSLGCYVSFVVRKAGNDNEVYYSEEFKVVPGVDRRLGGTLIKIICYHESNGIRSGVYYNNLHQNLLPHKNVAPKKPPPARKTPGIFILLVESLSRVNAHIQLPKTMTVLRKQYNATILNGKTISQMIIPENFCA